MDNASFRLNLAKHWQDDCVFKPEPIEDWDVSNVTDMSAAFAHKDCQGIDFSKWNTSKVTNMANMFYGASNVDGASLENLNTSKVTNMHSMFFMCGLFNPDLRKWNTSYVRDMTCMFDCSGFYGTGLPSWDVSNVNKMVYMFGRCDDMFTDDLTKWNTSAVTEMCGVFAGAYGVKCDVSQWLVDNVTDVDFSNGPAVLWEGTEVHSDPAHTEEEYAKDRFMKRHAEKFGTDQGLADATWLFAKAANAVQEFYSY